MEGDKQLNPDCIEPSDARSMVLQLSIHDPLYEKKEILLEAISVNSEGSVPFKNYESVDITLDKILQRARIICLDEVELYFTGVDEANLMGFNSPRNELEALHMMLSFFCKLLSNCNSTMRNLLEDLRNATVDMISEVGSKFGGESAIVLNCTNNKEMSLLQWGESNGAKTNLNITFVERAGRGAIAREDMKVGEVALEIPVSIIISVEHVHESDMFPILERIDGISSETMLLLWSMKEKYNDKSKFKLYFDTLPEVFDTGLSFGIDAIMALEGTLLLEEIVQAKEHLRSQYDQLFPALCNDHPDIFQPEFYTWEQFLWACELWYSNSMKVMFSDGKLRTCLIPIAGFLNHSLCPHIVNYGKVDSTTNSLKFPLSRPCNAGEQCFLSYGNFSSSHFATFYGFLPQGDNYYDIIPLDFYVPDTENTLDENHMSNSTSHMVRGTWLSKNHNIFHYGLPPPLLDHLRRARGVIQQTNTLTRENLESELEILGDLISTFEGMIEALGDSTVDDRESASWDVQLALEFIDLQRKIISSIVTSCSAGCRLVESELQKCMA